MATDRMLGAVVLGRRPRQRPGHVTETGGELELSYQLRRAAWGAGLADEAARALLHAAAMELLDQPVLIVTQAANQSSLCLAGRLGFVVVDAFEEFGARQMLCLAHLSRFVDRCPS